VSDGRGRPSLQFLITQILTGKKRGPTRVMTSCRPTDLISFAYCALLTGYFGYLATFYFKLQCGPLAGGHIGSGPPSGAGTLGAAAATNVLTNASIRNNALIRFIGFSPYT
jgi:hypothetical protein